MAVEFFVERNLFLNPSDWVSNKSDSVNKPQSEHFEASLSPDAMLVTNGLKEAWGGALVSSTRMPPVDSTGKLMNWIAFRLEFLLPKETADNCARLETDLKVCVKTRPNSSTYIRNVANFSTQWNADTGQFQIDLDPPGWVNTGFIVPDIESDVWHTLEYRFWFDDVALTFSVLSIQLDEQVYVIPENLQNVPMTNTNWEKTRKIQLQTEGYAAKSCVLVEYRNGILAWCNQRITMIPPTVTNRRRRELGGEFDARPEFDGRGEWWTITDNEGGE